MSTINCLPYNSIQAQKFCDLLWSMPERIVEEVLFIKPSYLLHNISALNLGLSLERCITTIAEMMKIDIPLLKKLRLKEIAADCRQFV